MSFATTIAGLFKTLGDKAGALMGWMQIAATAREKNRNETKGRAAGNPGRRARNLRGAPRNERIEGVMRRHLALTRAERKAL